MNRLRYWMIVPVALFAVVSVHSNAQENPAAAAARLSAAAQQYFTDVKLVTQTGQSVRFYSDLLKDKVVVINAFFATCIGACPKISGVLGGLQERLGDQLGRDVFLLSFSVDPETDTPQKLKEYGELFHARPGWLFLTGPKQNVDFALTKLGQKVARKEDHLTLFIVGNNRTGLWKKVFSATSTVDSLKSVVDSVLHDKGE